MAMFRSINSVALAATLAPVWAVSATAHAEPDRLTYELQERCSKSSREFVEKLKLESEPWLPGQNVYTTFRNHYNLNLNSCFLLVQTIRYSPGPPPPNDPANSFKEWTLYDVNENNQLAYFICTFNFIRDEVNNKESKWRACQRGDFPNIPSAGRDPTSTDGKQFAATVRLYMED
jgi:hypothetical protein